MSRKSREREREHFVWEEVMEIHDGKNRTEQKKRKRKKERRRKDREKSFLNLLSGLNPSVITSY